MGTPIRLLAAALGLALLSPTAFAQTDAPAAAPAPAPVQTVTGSAAWDLLKGNTIQGKTGGESFSEYFDPAGSVKYVDKDGASSGTWTVRDAKVCFDFPEDDDRTCSAFTVAGDSGTSTDDDGSTVRFQIVPGNSKGL